MIETSTDTHIAKTLDAINEKFSALDINGFIIETNTPYNKRVIDAYYKKIYSNSAGAIYRVK